MFMNLVNIMLVCDLTVINIVGLIYIIEVYHGMFNVENDVCCNYKSFTGALERMLLHLVFKNFFFFFFMILFCFKTCLN